MARSKRHILNKKTRFELYTNSGTILLEFVQTKVAPNKRECVVYMHMHTYLHSLLLAATSDWTNPTIAYYCTIKLL